MGQEVGTSREIFLKYILKYTNMKNGIDFYFSFMPERLVEGDALDELEKVPQLVSGSTQKCLRLYMIIQKKYFKM